MKQDLKKAIESKNAVVGVIGMGYIGLSILDALAKAGFKHLMGYDRDEAKVDMLRKGESYLNYLFPKELFQLEKKKGFTPSADPALLKKADVIIISVPTSWDQHQVPDLSNLRRAFHTVFDSLRKGQLVVLQSSTYPGTTEKELLPLLEKSKMKVGKDFYLACVPEVFNIGDSDFPFTHVPKAAGGVTEKCLEMAQTLYHAMGCKVVACSSPKVTEAAKLLQNSYRLVNISLINEMKIMFDRMGLDVWEVISAAATKPFGFVPFYPSPGAGGDCIPVSPAYLIWEAKESDGPTMMMEIAEHINQMIPYYVVDKISEGLSNQNKCLKDAKVLVLGVGYKKDIDDVRLSASLKILYLLKKKQADVRYHDPYVSKLPPLPCYPGLSMKSETFDYEKLGKFDAVVILTDHSYYDWKKIVAKSKLVIDTRNVTQGIAGSKSKVVKA